MGRRSNFERKPRDYYRTWDERAYAPLLRHLAPHTLFCEPCAGDYTLAARLEAAGHGCTAAWDIEPQDPRVDKQDATTRLIGNIHCFITNPPWDRKVLHPLIEHLSNQAPTWLLFDAAWAQTKQARPYLPRLRKIVAVGRLRWEEGTSMDAKDDCAWYLFDRPVTPVQPALFYGRID
ncbi:SAM-dependent methyl transferase [Caulobacter phage KcrB]|nr:SAM-dependent methyl transferase [Caulobacter phage RW]WCA46400.1 SAM-dependent methyl transferase [Caulobacter phage KcrB]WCD56335.1 SAM-dependent methyl transferase [Caulobacter phage RLK]WNV48127.1 DNA methyltransferase [Caulobacter phage GB2A]